MMTETDGRLLDLAGSARAIAEQKGRHFRARFGEIWRGVLATPALPEAARRLVPDVLFRLIMRRMGRKYLALHRSLLENFHGLDLAGELEALASGLGVDLPWLYGLNAVEIASAKVPFGMGCSSIAFTPKAAASGAALLAYNHDFPAAFGPFLCVQQTRPDKGFARLTLTYPVIGGAIAGVNEKGLAASLNHAYAADVRDMPALPFTALLDAALRLCADAREALDLIGGTPVPNGSILTLCDAGGAAFAVEASCGGKAVRAPEDGILCSFNKYLTPKMAAREIPRGAAPKGWLGRAWGGRGIHAHNETRLKRWPGLVKLDKKYSLHDAAAVMCDHALGPGDFGTICRHDAATMDTIASALIEPGRRSLRVAFGHPCRTPYREFVLA